MHTLWAVELKLQQVEILGNTPTETARYFALFYNKISSASTSSGSAALTLAANSPFDRWGLALPKEQADGVKQLSNQHNTAADKQHTRPVLSSSVLRALRDPQQVVVVMGLKQHADTCNFISNRYVPGVVLFILQGAIYQCESASCKSCLSRYVSCY
jgi:hypothetical protein